MTVELHEEDFQNVGNEDAKDWLIRKKLTDAGIPLMLDTWTPEYGVMEWHGTPARPSVTNRDVARQAMIASNNPEPPSQDHPETTMPNWVTTIIQAPANVISAMLNEHGNVDFNLAVPFPGPNKFEDGIFMDAELAAKDTLGIELSRNPLLAALEKHDRNSIDIKSMPEESFRQFVGMLENYQACNFLHSMDYARRVWGTKWNAARTQASPDGETVQFETGWACPEGVLVIVSKRFPEDVIAVKYADEDIGSNCGSFKLKAGEFIEHDIAPSWSSLDDAGKAKWTAFAHEVKGTEPEIEDEEA